MSSLLEVLSLAKNSIANLILRAPELGYGEFCSTAVSFVQEAFVSNGDSFTHFSNKMVAVLLKVQYPPILNEIIPITRQYIEAKEPSYKKLFAKKCIHQIIIKLYIYQILLILH